MNGERWQEIKSVLEAALQLDSPKRSAYLDDACSSDPSLRREVESLLEADKQAQTDFLCAPRLGWEEIERESASWIGRRIGPYEIIELIGEGGMGSVYRAARADEQYQKQVAIKVVKMGLGTPLALARFRAERQILANLDHPNIARLLDGGTTESGLPYVVMELIEGQPIDEYCEVHGLRVEERLRLFRTVCLAVHYAHQHLVVHRDLKPGNILVTADGVAKLLDFGIAKILDTESSPGGAELTINFMRMTPQFASPEQVRGTAVTTASDVYSLGVILFLLLTGHHPYQFDSRSADSIVRAICDTEPPKPSTVARRTARTASDSDTQQTGSEREVSAGESPGKLSKRLQGDLDNIVLMALRKDPQRRYASAEQFAEDIRRHLESLPVSARNDTVGYRASKFVTRHRIAVVAGTAVILALATGMGMTLREARIAKAQSMKAERRFQDIRALSNSLIFDVHDSIQDLAGATPARKLIVEKALLYLDGLAGESQGDASLQRELAAAYKRIGDVQGYDFNANLGDNSAALTSYEKALAIRRALWSSAPGNIEDALALAEASRLVSQTQMAAADLSAALANAQKTVELVEPLRKSHPNDAAVLLEFILDCQAVANILSNDSLSSLGNNATATVFRRKQLDAAEQLAGLDPGSDRGQGNLAIALTGMGDQLWLGGERAMPTQYYSRARAIFAKLVEHSEHKRARALYLMNLVSAGIADAELANGELDKALARAQETVESAEKLSQADPSDAQSGRVLADNYVMLAELESRSGRAQSASADMNKATQLIMHFAGPSSKDPTKLASLTGLYVAQGALASRTGDNAGALKSYGAAIAVFSRLQSANANNVGAREHLAATYNMIGRVQMKQRNFEAATVSFNRARALSNVEWSVANADAQELYTMADADTGIGDIEAALGADARRDSKSRADHWQQAVSCYERSLATWKEVREPGLASPDMFDAVPPSVVTRHLALAKAALTGLIVHETSRVAPQNR